METVRGKRKQHMARANSTSVDYRRSLHYAHDEAGDIKVAVTVDARHVRCLTADEGAAVFLTRGRHARNECDLCFLVDVATRKVIEEEQRLSTGGEDVVDAVIDEVLSDGVISVEDAGEQDLGSYPIGTGDEHRFAIGPEREHCAEWSDSGEHLWSQRSARDGFDSLDRAVRGIDVDAGGRVCVRLM